jgi:hypothetical protein
MYLLQEIDEEYGQSFLDILFGLLEKDGECCEKDGANQTDKATMRLAAATAILKLGRQKTYEQYITLSRFEQLALLSSVFSLSLSLFLSLSLHQNHILDMNTT